MLGFTNTDILKEEILVCHSQRNSILFTILLHKIYLHGGYDSSLLLYVCYDVPLCFHLVFAS